VTVGIIVLVAAVGAVVFARRRMSTTSGRGQAVDVDLQLNPLHMTPDGTNEGSGDALDTLLLSHSASVYEGD
jgi:hypothetical protein